jgi:hypothetical protein
MRRPSCCLGHVRAETGAGKNDAPSADGLEKDEAASASVIVEYKRIGLDLEVAQVIGLTYTLPMSPTT